MSSTVRLTAEEKQAFKSEGARLAYVLASSDMSDEMKSAWAALVPVMSIEELDRFMQLLEQYAPAHSSDRDKIFESLEKLAGEIQKPSEQEIK